MSSSFIRVGRILELDLTSLREAVHALSETLARANDEKLMSSLDEVTQYAIRAGVIQHFEFTYELSWKFIQRWLRLNASAEDAELPVSYTHLTLPTKRIV